MPIEHVLAVVPVSDLERADAWYEALFGRPADNRPMPSLVEWQVTRAGWPLAAPVDKPQGQRVGYVRDPFGMLVELATPL
jgi:hypothetical protein